jgi:hypothetical protein
MVEDINFPKSVPLVSATGRVKKVNRKKREEEKPPFEKFLGPEDQKGKKKKKKRKKANKAASPGKNKKLQARNSAELSDSTAPVETEEDSERKIIDVRV